ncbi:MAG: hypothetical protein AAF485_27040 [Chloroflexota bacterium]
MDNVKTVLLYVVGIIVLLLSTWLFEVEGDPQAAVDLTPTVVPTVRPTSTKMRIAAGPLGCVTTPIGGRHGYYPDAPYTKDLAPPEATGQPLWVSGTIYAADCVTPLPNVRIEVWHAGEEGHHPLDRFRGQFFTDHLGRYQFSTIKPSPFMGAQKFIPASINFQLHYTNTPTLATQLFFEGDPFLEMHNFSTAERRVTRPLTTILGRDGPILRVTFDITLATNPP